MPARGIINTKAIINVIGYLLIINAIMMLTAVPFSVYYGATDLLAIIISAAVTGTTGLGMMLFSKGNDNSDIKKREGYLIVALGWTFMALFGSLPYLISGAIPTFSGAIFETISGYTTTGASVLNDIEAVPKGILFWRSTTQWIGGMGIIVLTIAILPILGIGGMEMFIAEAPGPTKDKIHPRIKETAKRLWAIYVILTGTETILLMLCGMSFYDALNHSFTTISTGGFSTKQDSIAYYNSGWIELVITFFMFFSGVNFTVLYFMLKGQARKIWENDEFRWYASIVLLISLMVLPVVLVSTGAPFTRALRDSVFQIVSVITTTGFVTADYTQWSSFTTMLFFILLFSGASAGSTAGGIKIVRIVLLIKNGFAEFKRRIHPRAIIPVMMNRSSVSQDIIDNLLAFLFLYLIVFVFSSLVMTSMGLDFLSSIGAVATSLGNVGPGIGSVGPVDNFAHIPPLGKVFLSFLMLLGRLELFTVLILFTPYFWKRY